ncbi:ferredoxin [Mycolicibacterium smegmatis]|uniref:Ferredoxin n=4 Tax=Mycolicibacterium smegmatis TaxID=1772 RepID=I7FNU2_MYCS2|nr:ferredoxin [Mycolicibacterium smegmatis]AAD28345.1 putative ferredoxin [Mycolicibacterium smegmatis MC2 155]ABK72745.1 conserved domain protein [Mycolicibacterium smegmatis MC2 155]AFP42940.1 Fe3S4 ferredoxin [Mycolicibacterium smegmatis MC2 155]AIU11663.1 ferredoxin [Mycolicibacterium smegmatis MC2 155]AIU18288.1 ferredoxin [Mycolicibacterium smegmatis]
MRVSVDLNRCQDHGQCVIAAPSVFSMTDDGVLEYISTPSESERFAVEEAADVCPLQAITIED